MSAALVALAVLSVPAWGQYPGRVNPTPNQNGPHLRATAVMEYTGTLKHIKASRLVPVAVWDGLEYEPGDLYMADPAPLAVVGGTQYELERDGESKGFFNISDAEQIGGLWVGVGRFQTPKLVAKLRASGHMPSVTGGNIKVIPGQPHFAHVPPGSQDSGGNASGGPTLHQRPAGEEAEDNGGGQPANTVGDNGNGDAGPTLHRRGEAAQSSAPANLLPIDPDRPRLSYANPNAEKQKGPTVLLGFPPDMKQMAAVSDSSRLDTETHEFVWTSLEDQARMQEALEKIAEEALLPAGPAKAEAGHGGHATRHKKAAANPTLPALEDVQFHAYSLTFGSGATVVLSAQSGTDPVRYVTIIAQPDFYGTPQVLLKQVTTSVEMDAVPEMQLIDAVDTTGDGRADLVFELRGYTYREFAIYSVYEGTARQVFVTQPMSTPQAIVNPNSIS